MKFHPVFIPVVCDFLYDTPQSHAFYLILNIWVRDKIVGGAYAFHNLSLLDGWRDVRFLGSKILKFLIETVTLCLKPFFFFSLFIQRVDTILICIANPQFFDSKTR